MMASTRMLDSCHLSSSLPSTPSHPDVTLVTSSLSLYAHKAVLLSRLPSLSSLLCPSCSPHDPLLLLLPDTPAPALTSALEQLYTCSQVEELEDIFGLKQERKNEVIENQKIAEEIVKEDREIHDTILNQEPAFKIHKQWTSLEFAPGAFVGIFQENPKHENIPEDYRVNVSLEEDLKTLEDLLEKDVGRWRKKCPVCGRVKGNAANLASHMTSMHTVGKLPISRTIGLVQQQLQDPAPEDLRLALPRLWACN